MMEQKFNMWRKCNPNIKPEMNKKTLDRHFLRLSGQEGSGKENIEPSEIPKLSSTISREQTLKKIFQYDHQDKMFQY